jgi:hypothetical protein
MTERVVVSTTGAFVMTERLVASTTGVVVMTKGAVASTTRAVVTTAKLVAWTASAPGRCAGRVALQARESTRHCPLGQKIDTTLEEKRGPHGEKRKLGILTKQKAANAPPSMVHGAAGHVRHGNDPDRLAFGKKQGKTMNTRTKAARSDRNRQAIAGVKKHYANAPSIVVDGVSRTPAEIVRGLQASIDAADATSAANAAFHKAVQAEQAVNADGDALYRGLRSFLITQHKTAPETLGDFGITLASKRVPDAETVAKAVEKRAATRAARHTLGKRQKSAIKGQTPPAPVATATKTA